MHENGSLMVTNIEKVREVLRGVSIRDPELATKFMNPARFTQHDPHVPGGVYGLAEYVSELPREVDPLSVVRAFEDGPYVFAQERGFIGGQSVFFDLFRFEEGLIVEHWGFSSKASPPNQSGHTQNDGPTEADPSADTDRNKAILRDYYETVHIAGNHAKIPEYFADGFCVRHEPGVADGVAAFMQDVEAIRRHRTIDEIKFLLGEKDFVFVAAKGTHGGRACVYIDLFRLAAGKLVEHWGFPQEVPPRRDWKNDNGML